MSDTEDASHPQAAFSELDLFREQWQAELRQRPLQRIALTSRGTDTADTVELEPQELSAPVVAIWTLHDDVLCEIFYAVASMDLPASLEDTHNVHIRSVARLRRYFPGNLGWIRLSHVCQRWRDILLGAGMARLWGRVAFTYPPITAFPTLLSRSRNALLDTLLHTHAGSGPRVGFNPQRMRAAADNLARTRSLKVHSGISTDLQTFFAQPLSLPYLQELDLKLEYGSTPELLETHMAGLALPGGVVGNALPAGNISIEGPNVRFASIELVRLRAGVAQFHALHFFFPSLRHLEVRIHDHTAQISDLQWLISLLRRSPLLEILSLEITLMRYTPDWDALFAGAPAHLPHLQQLIIKEYRHIDLAPFIAQVCINPPAYISASCGAVYEAGVTGAMPQKTMAFIHDFGGYLCRPGHLALHISASLSGRRGDCSIGVQSMPEVDESVALAKSDLKHFDYMQDESAVLGPLPDTVEMSFRFSRASSANYTWLEALSSRIGNKELIEQLSLRVPHNMLHNHWMQMLRQYLLQSMTALRTLYILEPLASSSAFAVIWDKTVDVLRPSHLLIFPALHTLVVAFFTDDFGNINPQYLLQAWWIPLIKVLTERHKRGVPIHTLRIYGTWERDFKDLVKDLDTAMMACAADVVENVVDERMETFTRRLQKTAPLQRAGDRMPRGTVSG